MHRTTLSGYHSASTAQSWAHRPIDKEPRWIRVGRGTYPFSTYAAASAAYRATIDHLGLGVSEVPCCELLDEAGNLLARVAYNGRVFAVGPDGESDHTKVLHDTRGD